MIMGKNTQLMYSWGSRQVEEADTSQTITQLYQLWQVLQST